MAEAKGPSWIIRSIESIVGTTGVASLHGLTEFGKRQAQIAALFYCRRFLRELCRLLMHGHAQRAHLHVARHHLRHIAKFA
jgi:hypothetical protein